MKGIIRLGIVITAAITAHKIVEKIGWTKGVRDVLVENDIPSFTKTFENGSSITITK